MKKRLFTKTILLLLSLGMYAQPAYRADLQQEKLNRGLVAVRNNDGKTFLSWRYFQQDAERFSYQLWRNGVMLKTLKGTNYVDTKPGSTDDS